MYDLYEEENLKSRQILIFFTDIFLYNPTHTS